MLFCVEDDDNIRELMVYTLKSTGFDSVGFPSSQAFWSRLDDELPELIILDIMLPDEDGITILEKLRKNPRTQAIPVIMATAKGTEYDKVKGLDLGADDYLVKPFGMMEMISRIKAVLRRSQGTETSLLQIGDLAVNTQTYAVYVKNSKVQLTLKEFDLLHLLIKYPQRVFTRQELLDKVWGADYFGETRTVDVHIGTLRTKLGDCGKYIKTLRGVGYHLEVPK
ncbi:response regulator transcription factor [Streptococcus hyointestinalis]|uniref:response regulator transcription factor n=1 Tax=Streptococcus hyointestinalis TaxID=1337 RepID=UPI0013DFD00C|nr:response regulator transcription factor [Streptococcus hyointestinalis]